MGAAAAPEQRGCASISVQGRRSLGLEQALICDCHAILRLKMWAAVCNVVPLRYAFQVLDGGWCLCKMELTALRRCTLQPQVLEWSALRQKHGRAFVR